MIKLFGQWRPSGAFIVNFEQISHIVLVFLLFGFEQVNADWNWTTSLARLARRKGGNVWYQKYQENKDFSGLVHIYLLRDYVYIRDAFRTLSNIYDGASYEYS